MYLDVVVVVVVVKIEISSLSPPAATAAATAPLLDVLEFVAALVVAARPDALSDIAARPLLCFRSAFQVIYLFKIYLLKERERG